MTNIEQTYSASGSANYYSRIKGNYIGMIKYSTGTSTKSYYIANVPSLIYNNNGSVDLLDTSTYYVVNNGTNLPYQINSNITTNNKTADIIIKEITNSPTATLTGVNITSIITNVGGAGSQNEMINNLFSGSILSSFGGNIGVVTASITNTPITNNSSSSSNTASCTLSGTTIAHGANITAYSESNIAWNAVYSCTDRQLTRTCNNGVLDGSGVYMYNSCTKGAANNCSASGSYIKNGHTYSIPALNHSISSSGILSSNVLENNGIFKYTLSNITCNDGSYTSVNETTPTVQSCNSGYSINGNTCTPIIYSSCNAIKTALPTSTDGTYTIDPDGTGGNASFSAYCDMTTDGGGYTLCFSDKNQMRGTTTIPGYNFTYTAWSYLSSNNLFKSGSQVINYGNFCNTLNFSKIYSSVYSSPTTLAFSTNTMTGTTDAFTSGTKNSFSNGTSKIAIWNRTALQLGYFGGLSCAEGNNSLTQGTSVCVSNGSSYQLLVGNLNGAAVGDWMCSANTTCSQDTNIIMLFYVK